MFRYGYVDVSEIDSQGLQMLLMHYADEMFGDVGRAVEMEAVSDLLDSIITGAMMEDVYKRQPWDCGEQRDAGERQPIRSRSGREPSHRHPV